MRKQPPGLRRAERILELWLPADHAAAVAGDLLERASTPLCFWISIVRIAGFFVWRGFTRRLLPPIALGAAGWTAHWALAAVLAPVLPSWMLLVVCDVAVPLFTGYAIARSPGHHAVLFLTWGLLSGLTGVDERHFLPLACAFLGMAWARRHRSAYSRTTS